MYHMNLFNKKIHIGYTLATTASVADSACVPLKNIKTHKNSSYD